MITFKVVDIRTGKDITNTEMWVLRPDGSLTYNEYGDLIGCVYAKAVFTIKDEAGVAPVIHGKWIEHGNWFGHIEYECSACQGQTFDASEFKCCPHCGARMDKDKEAMTEEEYEELYCTYCDSQRCLNRAGSTVAEKCPYWEIRMGGGNE